MQPHIFSSKVQGINLERQLPFIYSILSGI